LITAIFEGHYAASSSNYSPKLWDNLYVQSSSVKNNINREREYGVYKGRVLVVVVVINPLTPN